MPVATKRETDFGEKTYTNVSEELGIATSEEDPYTHTVV